MKIPAEGLLCGRIGSTGNTSSMMCSISELALRLTRYNVEGTNSKGYNERNKGRDCMEAIDKDKNYTFEEVQAFTKEGERWELIDGTPYLLARSSDKHQAILFNLNGLFFTYLKDKKCKARSEAVVFLDENCDNYVIPDLFVTCNPERFKEKGFSGAPDLVVEILSTNAKRDRWEKYLLYQYAGVKEYWIIDQYTDVVEVHTLKDGEFKLLKVYDKEDGSIKVNVFEDLELNVNDVFEI